MSMPENGAEYSEEYEVQRWMPSTGASPREDDQGTPRPNAGFTLIEVLVAIALLAVCLGVLAQFFSSATARNMESETRSLLHQIATADIEAIRALPYGEVGTQLGIPKGPVPDQSSDIFQGVTPPIPVNITREITYVKDDSYTGPYPANYRRLTVIVESADTPKIEPVVMSTFVGGGAEGGVLDIRVTTPFGEPIPDARVKITNDKLNPRVLIDSPAIRTDANGHLLVPGLVPDAKANYFVTATKPGYNDAVSVGQIVKKGTPFTVVVLEMAMLSKLTVHVTGPTGAPKAGVDLRLYWPGGVLGGTYEHLVTTDSSGNARLVDLPFSTSIKPWVLVASPLNKDRKLAFPTGVDADPVDRSMMTQLGRDFGSVFNLGRNRTWDGFVAFVLDPGVDRTIEVVLTE